MTRDELLNSIIDDLGANYYSDDDVVGALLDEVVNDALFISNRVVLINGDDGKIDDDKLKTQLDILASNVRKCVKSIYLQRGAEDVNSQSLSGLNSTYANAVEIMKQDIIRSGKRIVI